MKRSLFTLTLIMSLLSCIPDSVKEKMNEGMAVAQQMLADQEFKKAIGQIELHKLRNGNYPNSLSDLQFLSAMDSSIFRMVEYTRLDSGYALNLKAVFPSIGGKQTQEVELRYPPEFWKGLGCVQSNVKKE